MMLIAGVDEAGRGPWAGPVVAASVILKQPIDGLNDSKKLSAKKREQLAVIIKEQALSYGIGFATVEEIDTLNILQASLLAMKRAILAMSLKPDSLIVDGLHLPDIDISGVALPKADALYPEVSAASILAKVARDEEMIALDLKYPGYGFGKHMGYGTSMHQEALINQGICDIHRKSFAPIQKHIIR